MVTATLRTFLILALAARGGPARAAELTVMTSGGFTAAFNALAPGFERQTGDRIVRVYGASMGATPTAIPARLARGEPADVVILARTALDALVKPGKVAGGTDRILCISCGRGQTIARGRGRCRSGR